MLNDFPSSEVHPDSSEFSHLQTLLDQWTQLTGTIDTDLALYPIWRYVADLVEDLEPANTGIWVDRVHSYSYFETPTTPILAAFAYENHELITP